MPECSRIYNGNDKNFALITYATLVDDLKTCVPKDWTEEFDPASHIKTYYGYEYISETFQWTENVEENPKYIWLQFKDNTVNNAREAVYQISLEFNIEQD